MRKKSDEPVLLGFIGDPVPPDGNPCSLLKRSFLGGTPRWLADPPDLTKLKCAGCRNNLLFICQISTQYASHQRVIYLFGCCKSRQCLQEGKSWVVLRACLPDGNKSISTVTPRGSNVDTLSTSSASFCERENDADPLSRATSASIRPSVEIAEQTGSWPDRPVSQSRNTEETDDWLQSAFADCSQPDSDIQYTSHIFPASQAVSPSQKETLLPSVGGARDVFRNENDKTSRTTEHHERESCADDVSEVLKGEYRTSVKAGNLNIKRPNPSQSNIHENISNASNPNASSVHAVSCTQLSSSQRQRKPLPCNLAVANSQLSLQGTRTQDVLPPFYIDVEEEPVTISRMEKALEQRARELLARYKYRESDGSIAAEDESDLAFLGTATIQDESYETSQDKGFQKFQLRLSRSPQQIIRYSFGGQPLWIHNNLLDFQPPKCERCGTERVFEMQLMPTLIYELKKRLSSCEFESFFSSTECTWGLVTIFTCLADCMTKEVYAEEYAVVQSV